VIDPVELPNLGKYDEAEAVVLEFEFKHDMNAYLASLSQSSHAPRTLAELVAFDIREREREMHWFGQDLFEQAQARGELSDLTYIDALKKEKSLAGPEGIDAVLSKNNLDALIVPTAIPAWTTDLVDGDRQSGPSSTAPAVAGYPHITVPGGFVHGLPVGLSFIGTAWSEPTLIKLAYAFEQATHVRKPPTFLAHVE
jgi:amidase